MSRLFPSVVLLAAVAAVPLVAKANDGYPVIYNFSKQGLDGTTPHGDLTVDPNGNLYGTALSGGTSNQGTVYKVVPAADGISPATSYTTLYSFTGGADGSFPAAGVILDGQGNIYGTASQDGAALGGTVFKLTPPAGGQTAWTETTLWSFGAGTDGRTPDSDLVFGPHGALFGTTNTGGSSGLGTVFELLPPTTGQLAWTEKVLWSFTGGPDGSRPAAPVVLDSNGAVYGTSRLGGASGMGVVFKLTPPTPGQINWSQSTLWSFTGGADGSEPSSSLVADSSGALYGTTTFGGSTTVNCAPGWFPYYNESQADNVESLGAPYLPAGGNACGTVFQLKPPTSATSPWLLTTIHAFQGSPDGGNPSAGLAMLPDSSLIGFTTNLGTGFYGSTYKLTPSATAAGGWAFTESSSFVSDHLGLFPNGVPVLGPANQVYGTFNAGGKTWIHVLCAGYGVVFSTNPAHNIKIPASAARLR
jgi:uncharacterized repeat protein (TIGR03803 family)